MKRIRVETTLDSDVDKAWEFWNEPKHIKNWAFASDDWEAPYAENNLKEGGKFLTRMSSKDGTSGFDFTGTYTTVIPNEKIEYVMSDGREVIVTFEKLGEDSTKVTEEFDMESENTEDVQRVGWQAILDNYKKYTEKDGV